MRLTDGQTDRLTDGQTKFSSHFIACSAVKLWTYFAPVLSQFTRLTDRQTDRQTGRHLSRD